MQVQSFLSQHRVSCGVEASSKKRALQALSQLIAADQPSLNPDDIFLNLIGREKLGSTGLGQGIAIPHCRIKNCAGTIAALIQLRTPVDFEAIDDQPVDILFALLVPEEAHDAHLQTLASLAERLNHPTYLEALRLAGSDSQLYEAAVSLDTP
ncbi:PTS IIA-like nitrogen regulatory protein PtsN [Pseudomaricurvus alkylphenolicus]|jgi:PTS system nitrogen regulatory IIA component|uniref:PTS IIA-like nitrogen regulatory protein PtsN n=1 Tax=Pseudomaricurvus alkylphenolicus TaxID=1306991 RepID=UPI001420E7D2|nr:PTS IIA-like nitrogen regulatory protein PtsN [Pseudomaricurvus alkylphenolicus]NIB41857.1 PTS IIA-like nitrogen regulatory protein PtsN [Pseudomaricurvus alkylphenolicus]